MTTDNNIMTPAEALEAAEASDPASIPWLIHHAERGAFTTRDRVASVARAIVTRFSRAGGGPSHRVLVEQILAGLDGPEDHLARLLFEPGATVQE